MKAYFLWLAKFLTIIVIILFAIPALLAGIAGAFSQIAGSKAEDEIKNSVGVVELAGVIESAKDTLDDLYGFMEDDDIHAIVLRINSPGGAVGPSQAIYSAVKKLKEKKPIVAVMDAVAASGGLYAALGASKVLAQPGTMTGSIGVIFQVPNVTEISEKFGVKMITLKAGKLKDAGNPFSPMPEETKEFLEETLANTHEQFIRDVAEGRGLSNDEVRVFADGRVLLGEDAKNFKLVDGYGDVYDGARIALELSGNPLPDDKYPQLVYKEDEFSKIRELFGVITELPKKFGSFALVPRYQAQHE